MSLAATRRLVVSAAFLVALAGATPAFAGAFLNYGNVTIGVRDEGDLNYVDDATQVGVGISLAGVGDGVYPGFQTEGWGVGISGINGVTNPVSGSAQFGYDIGFPANVTVDSFSNPSSSEATSVTSLASGAGLTLSQHYDGVYVDGAGGALFRDQVTVTNTSSDLYNGLLYRRVIDWNTTPNQYMSYVTIAGLPAANLFFTNDNGFDLADPFYASDGDLAGCGVNVNFVDCGLAAQGAHFDFNFGDLAAGQSKTFNIFFGAAYSEAAAMAALGSVGAEVYSLGQSGSPGSPTLGTPGTWMLAFSGVGGTPLGGAPVPEPASLLLLGSGLCGVAAISRRRRQRSA